MEVEETNRVRLVEMAKSGDDAVAVAALDRLLELPVPSRSIMMEVAKDIARVAKKHGNAAVKGRAMDVKRKWIQHYGGSEPAPKAPAAPAAAPAAAAAAPAAGSR